jgi:hypothetical protein
LIDHLSGWNYFPIRTAIQPSEDRILFNSYTVCFWRACVGFERSFDMSVRSFFPRVDLAAHRDQVQAIALQLHEHPPSRAASPPPKLTVGRPKVKRTAEAALVAAAAVAELPPFKRGKYTRWFDSPYINDILAAYARTGSARSTVAALRKSAPDDRYARLSHSTVDSWFDKQGKLLSQYQQQLEAGRAAATYIGPSPALRAAPGVEDAICDILLRLRTAGTPLNSHIIRWVMLAVLQKHPTVLQQITLSQQFISKFVRNNPRLQFRWRARTTAASKLPDDWEEQGIHMAKRMGATMQLHKVRHCTHQTKLQRLQRLEMPHSLVHCASCV